MSAQTEQDAAQGVVWDLTPLFRDTAAWDTERQQAEAAPCSPRIEGDIATISPWGERNTRNRGPAAIKRR